MKLLFSILGLSFGTTPSPLPASESLDKCRPKRFVGGAPDGGMALRAGKVLPGGAYVQLSGYLNYPAGSGRIRWGVSLLQRKSYTCCRILAILYALAVSTVVHAQATGPAVASPGVLAQRGLKIVVDTQAPATILQAAQSVLAAVGTQSLMVVLSGQHPPTSLTDSQTLMAAKPQARAYDHLILIGLPTDPIIAAAWQREAQTEGTNGIYIFGYGHLAGDIGYIESDRNPFLHGAAIAAAPYETEVVTITGTTPAGVALAAQAFVQHGLVAGVVAASGWKRTRPNLLERDPLKPDFSGLEWVPSQVGDAVKVGLTQASEDEYRGVLSDTQVEPVAIWRVKFYIPGAWDGAGQLSAFDDYSYGLHRRAYGNSVWCAEFASAAEATAVAPKIVSAAGLHFASRGVWKGAQPPYGFQTTSSGPLALWTVGRWVFMSTLPAGDTAQLLATPLVPQDYIP